MESMDKKLIKGMKIEIIELEAQVDELLFEKKELKELSEHHENVSKTLVQKIRELEKTEEYLRHRVKLAEKVAVCFSLIVDGYKEYTYLTNEDVRG